MLCLILLYSNLFLEKSKCMSTVIFEGGTDLNCFFFSSLCKSDFVKRKKKINI